MQEDSQSGRTTPEGQSHCIPPSPALWDASAPGELSGVRSVPLRGEGVPESRPSSPRGLRVPRAEQGAGVSREEQQTPFPSVWTDFSGRSRRSSGAQYHLLARQRQRSRGWARGSPARLSASPRVRAGLTFAVNSGQFNSFRPQI